MLRHLLLMTGLSGCAEDCSGRGDCNNGTCLCEIRYAGDVCEGPNVPYHAGIGGVFLLVALTCAIQLTICIVSEYQRLKAPSFLRACKITTQKLLYFVAFLASAIRGAYFLSPDNLKQSWSSSLLSAYYPLLMTASSLIICFWAEVFHLRDIRWERPQFLSKSFLGFVTFNIITYGLLIAEIVTTQLASPPPHDKSFYSHLFNGCYATLMFIVTVFFLIYGVEVFFKLRGGFTAQLRSSSSLQTIDQKKSLHLTQENNLLLTSGDQKNGGKQERSVAYFNEQEINNSQLHQSRIGLITQSLMLITIAGFLFSETLSEFWKNKVPVYSRNWHDVVFRVFEMGVAIWFPAVLWNSIQPSELWILNPRKLLRSRFDQKSTLESTIINQEEERSSFINTKECWICYDSDKPEALIQPCSCTGDVSSVHHDCLKRWLMESSSSSSTDSLRCKVCNDPYNVKTSEKLDWERGFTAKHWGYTVVVVTAMCVAVSVAWIAIQMFESPYIRMLSASIAVLVVYICIRFLGQNTISAYQRAKVGGLHIINHSVSTISDGLGPSSDEASSSTSAQQAASL